MAEIKYNLGSLGVVPSGAVIPFAGSIAPQGYLLCDGSEVSRADYPYLFDAIGTIYGEGDGSTTFNLPNLQDKFIEGSGTNAVGTEMSAGLPNITGGLHAYTYLNGTPSGALTSLINNTNQAKMDGARDSNYVAFNFNASRSNSIYGKSSTVQPPSIVMQYIIKY